MLLTERRTEEKQATREDIEFQLFRMQQNVKEIAKDKQVIGIEQTKEEEWVIVSMMDDGNSCHIMIHQCNSAYRGHWDFMLQAQYIEEFTLFIGDIKGEENRGYGSICIDYLKDHAKDQNIHRIKGDLAKRDWDHLDRLIHFYEKHHFDVEVNEEEQFGEIEWRPNF
ncbi:GNAT family N-acetyltransferase [Bacillus sp. JCM 19034]|uniref:GNAT family N-acetyltransferase n=1 Tax=Bacillus sp. JCM 19034 TaxID=1481928 RepID=UPI00078672B9|nr:GNAT family N-acetyltransferase [Bacillus sp. JCM 19034]